jgi:glyoxylase-like metal-dependent hydrolase (beta-lactamase superfamily II)
MELQAQMFGVDVEPSPDPNRFLSEGDRIEVGGASFRVVHAPGHSPGHIMLVGDGVVFCGDVLFQGSIGRTDLPGGDYHQLLASIRDKLLILPDETVVYPGHGPSTTIGDERRTNPFLVDL